MGQTEEIQIEDSWAEVLNEEFQKSYFRQIRQFLKSELRKGKTIYPPGPKIFNAFNKTPFNEVRVVILGQDPYHGPGQAMGLCFSVPRDVKVPASLKNIFKELHRDVGMEIPDHGDLTSWAEQGVFLLNAFLTVEHREAASHQNIGWQRFTNAVIQKISEEKENVIFLLWGNFAKKKKDLIDELDHYVLESAHPSPLAGNAFFDNHHFSRTNEILLKHGHDPIQWELNRNES